MIMKARERRVYDELLLDDLIPPLTANLAAFDLVVSADVFIYVGALEEVFAAANAALRSNGIFLFSTEKADVDETFVLRDSGRYAHSVEYIKALARDLGMDVVAVEDVILRKEADHGIEGNVFLLRRG
jgi:predicted TPR repeat methyltransferase